MKPDDVVKELQSIRGTYQATFDNCQYPSHKLSYRRKLNAIDAAIGYFKTQIESEIIPPANDGDARTG